MCCWKAQIGDWWFWWPLAQHNLGSNSEKEKKVDLFAQCKDVLQMRNSSSGIIQKLLPPKKAATVCSSAAPYLQLQRKSDRNEGINIQHIKCKCIYYWEFFVKRHDLQLMDVVIFDIDVKVVLLQEAVHTGLQPADVLFHLVVIHSW